MGRKADRQAARIAAARWRDFCDSWVAIGRRAGAEHRRLTGRQTAEERRQDMARARLGMVLAMAAAIGAPMPRGL